MKRYELNGRWKMTGNGYAVEGNIPGSVYSFLHVDNALLPDPYYRENEEIYLEVAEHTYTFERTFTHTRTNNPVFLVFEGLDTLCSVYVNGQKIADTDNMHLRYSFAVGDFLQEGENCLQVVCHPVNPHIKALQKERRLFGANDCMEGYPHIRKAHCMMGWDWGPRLPDAGIWRDVYLVEENSAYIVEVHPAQRHENGRVFLTPTVEMKGDAEIEITLQSPDGDVIFLVPNQETEIQNAKLWWPNGWGEQPLYRLTVALIEKGERVDERQFTIGLRENRLVRKADEYGESFYHEINGVAMFAMGADYIPEDNIFSRITPERTRALLTYCRDSHFNAIRVWGGGYYPDDFFFELCDELGLVVFFDCMFACSVYEPSEAMKKSVEEEVAQNLRRIRHHACLGLVCGNNEIEWHFHEYVAISGRSDLDALRAIYLEMFETLLPKIVAEVAPYLPYIPSSPTSGGNFIDPNGEAKGDCHDWEPDYLRVRNRYFRYVSEFGFQSFPCIKTVESFTTEADRNVHSRVMERHQRSFGGTELIINYLTKNFLYPNDFGVFLYATQVLQAESVRYRVEHFRRNRGRCMGTLYWQLNDIWPVTSWASIDYYGRWKGLQYAAKRFYAPVLISCEEVGELQTRSFINAETGTYSNEKSARLCVTNDTLHPITGVVKWELRDENSRLLSDGEQSLTVEKLSAQYLPKMQLEGIDVERTHLYFAFVSDEKTLSEGSVLFTLSKRYAFQNPHLRCQRQGDELVVFSDGYAKSVQIEGEDGDLWLDDNFFDMEKGEKRVRILMGDAKKIRLRSVYDIR